LIEFEFEFKFISISKDRSGADNKDSNNHPIPKSFSDPTLIISKLDFTSFKEETFSVIFIFKVRIKQVVFFKKKNLFENIYS
jgi:hypothetical protein